LCVEGKKEKVCAFTGSLVCSCSREGLSGKKEREKVITSLVSHQLSSDPEPVSLPFSSRVLLSLFSPVKVKCEARDVNVDSRQREREKVPGITEGGRSERCGLENEAVGGEKRE
jgi:hypothetical protein